MIDVNYNEYKETIADNMKLIQENHKLKEEIERLNNIIKEVREYINKNGIIDLNGYDLLEILDKVDKENK